MKPSPPRFRSFGPFQRPPHRRHVRRFRRRQRGGVRGAPRTAQFGGRPRRHAAAAWAPAGSPRKRARPKRRPRRGAPGDLEPLGGYAGQAGAPRRSSSWTATCACARTSCTRCTWVRPTSRPTRGPERAAAGTLSRPRRSRCRSMRRRRGALHSKNLGGANIRLRLEPTINVTDQVRVLGQVDMLDNTILGSTPDSRHRRPGPNLAPAAPSLVHQPGPARNRRERLRL